MWTLETNSYVDVREEHMQRSLRSIKRDLSYIEVEDNWQLLLSCNLFLVLMIYIFHALPVIWVGFIHRWAADVLYGWPLPHPMAPLLSVMYVTDVVQNLFLLSQLLREWALGRMLPISTSLVSKRLLAVATVLTFGTLASIVCFAQKWRLWFTGPVMMFSRYYRWIANSQTSRLTVPELGTRYLRGTNNTNMFILVAFVRCMSSGIPFWLPFEECGQRTRSVVAHFVEMRYLF